MPQRPPHRTGPADLSDRNRKALAALRRLWAQPLPARTAEAMDEWIREIRIMREESTQQMLEKFELPPEEPVAPPAGDDSPPPSPPEPRSPALNPAPESPDPTATSTPRSEPPNETKPRPTPVRPDPDTPSDRNRDAIEALRSLAEHPPHRTDAEAEARIREIRIERQAATRKMPERLEQATGRPAGPAADSSE